MYIYQDQWTVVFIYLQISFTSNTAHLVHNTDFPAIIPSENQQTVIYTFKAIYKKW